MIREKQIDEMAKDVAMSITWCDEEILTIDCLETATLLYDKGYRKQSAVIDEFVERLKEQPIKCGLPLFGLSTKGEIEAYCNCILLQMRDAIDSIAEEMKGGAE